MQIAVITSCSLGGWNQYGQKCLQTILQHWPKEVAVHLVSEDKLPLNEVKGSERVLVWNLLEHHTDAKAFYTRHKDNKRAHGRARSGYNFREDAFKFSKKVFAIDLVARYYMEGRLLWLDADTVTLKDIPLEFLEKLLPEEFDVGYLARRSYHSECGFIAYNMNRIEARNFIRRFAELYTKDEVFSIKEWHDSWVFDWLRTSQPIKSYPIPHTNNAHPFVYSDLGKYMDHLKGARKNLGMSVEHPRFNRRKGQ